MAITMNVVIVVVFMMKMGTLTMVVRICNYCNKKIPMSQKYCDCRNERLNEYNKQYYEENKEQRKLLNSKKWKDTRKIIIKRDAGMCNRCYVQLGLFVHDELQVHHIKPRITHPELVYDPENLITICKTCNLQLGTNGIDWEIKRFNQDFFEPKL